MLDFLFKNVISKTSFKFFVLVLASWAVCIPSHAQELEVKAAGKTQFWNEARQTCQGLGEDWDLPTPEMVLELVKQEKFNSFFYYEVTKQNRQEDYAFWVRSENNNYNTQLKNRSVALRISADGNQILELDLSQSALRKQEMELNLIESFPEKRIRTAQEQKLLEDTVMNFQALYPKFELDLYRMYKLEDLAKLGFLNVLDKKIIKILLKAHPEQLEVDQKNRSLFLKNMSEGIDTICVR